METKLLRALLILLGAVITASLSLLILYENLLNIDSSRNYGLIGVFLAALFSHLTVIARGLFIPLFLALTESYNPMILGLAAGLGGAFGELTAYYWGLGIKEALASNKQNNNMPKWVEKYGLIAVLLFAASPLPDTPIILLAGSLRFPLWKLLIIQIIGKTTLYSLGAVVGGLIFMELSSVAEEMTVSTIILIASIILCIAVSWSKSREKLLELSVKIMSKIGIRIEK